ncbi:MAG TPA: DUF2127 domain-containing protein [Candidatus Acidoferrales bacterium]|nr:DUF2127 domain-containing protein [Candidatus Acidoferrales bacterium]
MTAKDLLRDAFRTGITIKGLDGLLEISGGVLLWFVKPSAMGQALRTLSLHELSRDPHDFVAIHLLPISEKLAHSSPLFASLFLFSHGLAKVGLAMALWLNELWAYPLAMGVFSAFGVYQIYRLSHTHSLALAILTVLDAVVVWLTWEEYRVQKAEREAGGGFRKPGMVGGNDNVA